MISLFKYSFFSMCKLKCNEILNIAYLWLAGCSSKMIMMLTGHRTESITQLLKDFQQLIASSLDADDTIIGGPGIIIEIDKVKFRK